MSVLYVLRLRGIIHWSVDNVSRYFARAVFRIFSNVLYVETKRLFKVVGTKMFQDIDKKTSTAQNSLTNAMTIKPMTCYFLIYLNTCIKTI